MCVCEFVYVAEGRHSCPLTNGLVSRAALAHQAAAASLPQVLTARFRAARASIAPMTPSVPSYMPASGMASQWDPVSTEPRDGSEPSQRPKMLPMASSLQGKSRWWCWLRIP